MESLTFFLLYDWLYLYVYKCCLLEVYVVVCCLPRKLCLLHIIVGKMELPASFFLFFCSWLALFIACLYYMSQSDVICSFFCFSFVHHWQLWSSSILDIVWTSLPAKVSLTTWLFHHQAIDVRNEIRLMTTWMKTSRIWSNPWKEISCYTHKRTPDTGIDLEERKDTWTWRTHAKTTS